MSILLEVLLPRSVPSAGGSEWWLSCAIWLWDWQEVGLAAVVGSVDAWQLELQPQHRVCRCAAGCSGNRLHQAAHCATPSCVWVNGSLCVVRHMVLEPPTGPPGLVLPSLLWNGVSRDSQRTAECSVVFNGCKSSGRNSGQTDRCCKAHVRGLTAHSR